ncbi:MAG: ABC transporter ATP-binding protein [Halanaeroarchaeum sp.]
MSDAGRSDVALSTDGLTKTFGEIVAVGGVDLDIERGEIRTVIGPNGAGKTTLFNTIMGHLEPTDGRVRLDGEDITDTPEEARPHAGLARSFQSNQLFVDEPVLENIRIVAQHAETGTFSLDFFRRGKSVARERALDIAETLDLLDVHDEVAKNLSHGDQRRLGIAMALATDPDVLLLDEPTSGMSPSATYETTDLIADVQEEYDLTMILIEHDMDVVLSVSDHITVLNRGSVITTGTPAEVQANDDVQEAYLGGVSEELE